MEQKYFVSIARVTMIVICLSLQGLDGVAQSISINLDGAAPDNSAMLDVKDTTKGLLPPRMSVDQMNSVVSPANGLLVYNTDSSAYFYYNNIEWVNIGTSSLSSGELYTNNGNVGIGITNPVLDFQVAGSEGKSITTTDIGTGSSIDDFSIDDNANVVRITGFTSNVDITGFTGGVDGRIIHVLNPVDKEVKFLHNQGSTAGNRLLLKDGGSKSIKENQVASFIYSAADNGWFLMSEH